MLTRNHILIRRPKDEVFDAALKTLKEMGAKIKKEDRSAFILSPKRRLGIDLEAPNLKYLSGMISMIAYSMYMTILLRLTPKKGEALLMNDFWRGSLKFYQSIYLLTRIVVLKLSKKL